MVVEAAFEEVKRLFRQPGHSSAAKVRVQPYVVEALTAERIEL